MPSTINASNSGSGGLISTGDASGVLALQTAGTTAVTIDTSQRVGINNTSPQTNLSIKGTAASPIAATYNGIFGLETPGQTSFQMGIGSSFNGTWMQSFNQPATAGSYFDLVLNPLGGNVLVGGTNASQTAGVGIKLLTDTTSPTIDIVLNTPNNNTPYLLYNTNATYNGYRWYVKVDGGIANFSGNNINLSDERTKTNIEASGNYLSKICAIPVKLFNYKDEQENEQRTLGVIAQDVEISAPELVNNEGFGDTPEDGIPLKSIYTTDMMFALMKSIQELKAINDTQAEELSRQAATINALVTRIEALENK